MRSNTEYKNEALSILKGKWGVSVLAVIVYVVVSLLAFVPYEIKVFTMEPTDLKAAAGLARWLGFGLIVAVLVLGPLLVGLVNAFKKLLLAGDDRVVYNEFKIGFGNWLHHVWGYLLKSILIALWSLLFIIPGIVKSLAYSMTNYILVDHPELSVNRAIDLSQEMMRGHKYDLFYLYLGFAGWFLLSIITLGLGFFWLVPYAQVAQASFYQDVKAEWEAKHSV